ncbi:response regulator receiver protein [Magnetococcus marinus MC-1]|uniref:Response regulator receiver protein n=1 Tax=Magnetococcus marinus (strain ATCC BAA-1437 / JCM 17883 / MC-1) TaxID=156889 RepID=A0LCM4_MAGMM|nr:response regulator [Magnetococcus marinus]ABK45717.1 response regulator receiver protein [Magnetococcus marinus MC-1]
MATILFIDDDEVMLTLISPQLEEFGYQLVHAFSGREGMQALQEHAIDLILTDLDMPDMNGIEMIQQIRAQEESAHIPIVVLTAYDSLVLSKQATSLGADLFQSKPVDVARLHPELQALLNKTSAAKLGGSSRQN